MEWAAKLKQVVNGSYNIPLWHAKSPISLASTVPRLHLTKYLQATTSYRVCRFRFTDQIGAKGHSALETLVYLAVHFYYIVFVYVCITPSRFPVSFLSNIDFALYSCSVNRPPHSRQSYVQRNYSEITTKLQRNTCFDHVNVVSLL